MASASKATVSDAFSSRNALSVTLERIPWMDRSLTTMHLATVLGVNLNNLLGRLLVRCAAGKLVERVNARFPQSAVGIGAAANCAPKVGFLPKLCDLFCPPTDIASSALQPECCSAENCCTPWSPPACLPAPWGSDFLIYKSSTVRENREWVWEIFVLSSFD